MEPMFHIGHAGLWALALLGLLTWAYLRAGRGRTFSTLPLPPGPKPLPIIGNLLHMPTKNMAPALHELSKKHGGVMYLDVFGQHTVVIESYDAAIALLETRSANTSDRPRLVMAELVGLMWEFTLLGYNATLKRCRRSFHDLFHPGAVGVYQPAHLRGTRKFLNRLLDTPDDFYAHVRGTLSATIMDVVYGMEVEDENNRYLTIVQKGARIFSEVAAPGRFLVELFPFLAHIPAWFPGANFKRNALQWKDDLTTLRDVPYEAAVEGMARGSAKSSITSRLMDKAYGSTGREMPSEDIEHYKDIIGVAYVAAFDTTVSTLLAFVLAIVSHPEAQKKAQAELDAVVGPDRLPDFADRESLPYIDAILKETTRWHPVVPLGIPHKSFEDDVYDGYHIPAGTVLIPNCWAMSRDPTAYPEPEVFLPERFMNDGSSVTAAQDPSRLQFGFGRRVCPGRHFATDALFIFIASFLHVFDIQSRTGADGRPEKIDRRVDFDCTLSAPEPFLCKITPRSPRAAALVREAGLEL